MLELAYQRYVRTSALIGSPESVAPIVESLRGLGVDEIACLVDFGVEPALVGESLPWIAALQQRFRERRPIKDAAERLRLPLTEVQRDLWTVAQLGREASLAYLEAGVLEMRGPLDAALLRRGLPTVGRRLGAAARLGREASLPCLEAGVLEMRGPLDAALLRRALQTVVHRHEALRSVV